MPQRGNGLLKDLFTLALLIVLIVLPLRAFVISPFVVDGESMHPTFENLDYLIVDELSYHFKAPSRGDVIVFRYPKNTSVFYIKRVIGLPGETVSIRKGVVNIKEPSGETLTLSSLFDITDRGWYILTWRWAQMFCALSVSNELVWHTLSQHGWVTYKLIITFATVAFGLYQIRLARHERNESASPWGMRINHEPVHY